VFSPLKSVPAEQRSQELIFEKPDSLCNLYILSTQFYKEMKFDE